MRRFLPLLFLFTVLVGCGPDSDSQSDSKRDALDGSVHMWEAHRGLTVRDYIAIQLVAGLAVNNEDSHEVIAKEAYELADALITAQGGD